MFWLGGGGAEVLLKISAGEPGFACKSTRFCSQPPEMGQLLVRAPLCHLYQALPYLLRVNGLALGG